MRVDGELGIGRVNSPLNLLGYSREATENWKHESELSILERGLGGHKRRNSGCIGNISVALETSPCEMPWEGHHEVLGTHMNLFAIVAFTSPFY